MDIRKLQRAIVDGLEDVKGHNIVVDLGKTEGVLPAREQTPRETYRPGDRIVAFVKNIDRESRGRQAVFHRVTSTNVYFYTLNVLYETRSQARTIEEPDHSTQAVRLEKEQERWGKPVISLPDLYQRGPNVIRDGAVARKIVRILEEHGWLVPAPPGSQLPGRASRATTITARPSGSRMALSLLKA